MAAMLWDIFCRVIDNFGDIGVCWRLSADLAGRGHQVRLWIDDASSLAWMAPDTGSVSVRPWAEAEVSPPCPGDVVVEAFGCNPPAAFVTQMQRDTPPKWINLEYLSAEDYVERSHGLQSPVWSGPGAGLKKWFFYPGFTERTGGLLREPALLAQRDAFLAAPNSCHDWLAKLGVAPALGGDAALQQRYVSVFCYASAPLPMLLDALSEQLSAPSTPTGLTLLLTPGHASRMAQQWQQQNPDKLADCQNRLVMHELPHLTQVEFDRLLWACDVNLVRGEDSAVRALWAARPHVWQIYEQDDGVHEDKLQAFMNRWMAGWDPELSQSVQQIWRAWNNLPLTTRSSRAPEPMQDLAKMALSAPAWQRQAALASQNLAKQTDLSTQLLEFVTHTG